MSIVHLVKDYSLQSPPVAKNYVPFASILLFLFQKINFIVNL